MFAHHLAEIHQQTGLTFDIDLRGVQSHPVDLPALKAHRLVGNRARQLGQKPVPFCGIGPEIEITGGPPHHLFAREARQGHPGVVDRQHPTIALARKAPGQR